MRYQFIIRHSGLVRLSNLECSKFQPTLLISPEHIKTNWCWKVRFVDWIKLSQALMHLVKQICCWIDSTALALYWKAKVCKIECKTWLMTCFCKQSIISPEFMRNSVFLTDTFENSIFVTNKLIYHKTLKWIIKIIQLLYKSVWLSRLTKNLFVSKRYMTYYCVLTRTVTWFKYTKW